MNSKNPFKWRHFEQEIILLNVRCYLRYALSYRDLEEMMLERVGGEVDHTTIYRWVQSYSPDIEKRCKPHLQPTNDSYRVDETMHMIRKGQIEGIKKGDVKNQIQFIENLFELAT